MTRNVRLDIPLPASFSFDAVVRSHGWYDLAPYRYDPGSSVLETAIDASGTAADLRFETAPGDIRASARGVSARSLFRVARRIFSLDRDLSAFVGAIPAGGPLARALARGGGRMLRAPSIFEDAVKMLFTTNCSWAATKGMVVRLIALAGAEGRAFPEPGAVARLSPKTLEREVRCGYRATALARFARRVASGKLDLSRWEDPDRAADAVRREILAEHGFALMRRRVSFAFSAGTIFWLSIPGRARSTGGCTRGRPRKPTARSAAAMPVSGLALWLDLTRDWHEGDHESWP